MAHQSKRNDFESYYAGEDVQGEVNQLFEASMFRPLNRPAEGSICVFDEQGTGIYPLSDNAGATLKTNITIDVVDNIGGANSLSLTPTPINPVDDTTIWINSSNGHAYRGGVDLETVGSGSITGPVSSTTNALLRWTNTTGTVVKDSLSTLSDAGDLDVERSVALPYSVDGAGILFGGISCVRRNFGLLAIGFNTAPMTVSATDSYIVGDQVFQNATVIQDTIAIGDRVGAALSSAVNSVFLGHRAAGQATGTVSSCVFLGAFAGNQVTGPMSNRIYIGNQGDLSDTDNIIKLGTIGTHNIALMSGIYNQPPPITSTDNAIAGITSTGQLTQGAIAQAILFRGGPGPPAAITLTHPIAATDYEIQPVGMGLSSNYSNKFTQSANGRIQYLGSVSTSISVTVCIVVRASTTSGTYQFSIKKNGITVMDGSLVSENVASGAAGTKSIFLHGAVNMITNDYISVFSQDPNSANSLLLTTYSVNITTSS